MRSLKSSTELGRRSPLIEPPTPPAEDQLPGMVSRQNPDLEADQNYYEQRASSALEIGAVRVRLTASIQLMSSGASGMASTPS